MLRGVRSIGSRIAMINCHSRGAAHVGTLSGEERGDRNLGVQDETPLRIGHGENSVIRHGENSVINLIQNCEPNDWDVYQQSDQTAAQHGPVRVKKLLPVVRGIPIPQLHALLREGGHRRQASRDTQNHRVQTRYLPLLRALVLRSRDHPRRESRGYRAPEEVGEDGPAREPTFAAAAHAEFPVHRPEFPSTKRPERREEGSDPQFSVVRHDVPVRVPCHVKADERPDDDGKDRGCHPMEMMTSMIMTPPRRARARARARARSSIIIIENVRIVPPTPIGVGTARPQYPTRAIARQRRL